MLKEKVVKYRSVLLMIMLITWILMLLAGVGLAGGKDVVRINKYDRTTFYDLYVKQEYKLYIYDITQSEYEELLNRGEEVEIPSKVYDIKTIYLSIYLVFALVILAWIVLQKLFSKKRLPSVIYLLGLLPFIVSCCICLRANTSYIVKLEGDGGVVHSFFGNYTYLPALGDWLSAIIALIMFGFSWLCNHWIKQGVPLPEPKQRKPRKPKAKTDKERIAELEKQVEELKRSNS